MTTFELVPTGGDKDRQNQKHADPAHPLPTAQPECAPPGDADANQAEDPHRPDLGIEREELILVRLLIGHAVLDHVDRDGRPLSVELAEDVVHQHGDAD